MFLIFFPYQSVVILPKFPFPRPPKKSASKRFSEHIALFGVESRWSGWRNTNEYHKQKKNSQKPLIQDNELIKKKFKNTNKGNPQQLELSYIATWNVKCHSHIRKPFDGFLKMKLNI